MRETIRGDRIFTGVIALMAAQVGYGWLSGGGIGVLGWLFLGYFGLAMAWLFVKVEREAAHPYQIPLLYLASFAVGLVAGGAVAAFV